MPNPDDQLAPPSQAVDVDLRTVDPGNAAQALTVPLPERLPATTLQEGITNLTLMVRGAQKRVNWEQSEFMQQALAAHNTPFAGQRSKFIRYALKLQSAIVADNRLIMDLLDRRLQYATQAGLDIGAAGEDEDLKRAIDGAPPANRPVHKAPIFKMPPGTRRKRAKPQEVDPVTARALETAQRHLAEAALKDVPKPPEPSAPAEHVVDGDAAHLEPPEGVGALTVPRGA